MVGTNLRIDDDLHPCLKFVTTNNLFQACFNAISGYPELITTGNSKPLFINSEFMDTTPMQEELFRGIKTCELSISEALSLCYVGEYIREVVHKGQFNEYYVPIQIERSFHRDQRLKEWYLGDGMLSWFDNGLRSDMPVQETKAVNYTSSTSSRVIEYEIIRVINDKVADAKRKNYNDICALLVSVMPKASNIDYGRIITQVDISNYHATYLVEYSNSFRSGTVFDLLSHKKGVQGRTLTITPRLVRA